MDRQAWFEGKRWGFFTHYLAGLAGDGDGNTMDAEAWNTQVNGFNVSKLVGQLKEFQPDYFCITIGQNSGHYLAPNHTYDALTGIVPSKCSRRDLVAELIEALEGSGIDLFLYLPSGAPCADEQAVRALEWQENSKLRDHVEAQDRLVSFQRKWEAIIREWSLRWGKSIKGWWIDGCYSPDIMYNFKEEPNFKSLTDAIRAGNPQAVVALAGGTKCPFNLQSPYDDYTAGEVGWSLPLAIDGKADMAYMQEKLGGKKLHVLSFLGDAWSQGAPRFPVELAVGYSKYLWSKDGIITWDAPLKLDGEIPAEFREQLKAISRAAKESR